MRAALPGSAGQDAKPAVQCCLQPAALSPDAVQGSHLPSEKRHQLSVIRQLPLCLLPWTWKFQPPQGFLVPSGYSFASIPTAFGGSQSSEVYQAQLTGPYSKCNHSRWLSSPLLVWFLFFFFLLRIFFPDEC